MNFLKNWGYNMSLTSKKFWKDALERAGKTTAQVMATMLTVDGIGMLDVNWPQVLSVSGLAGIISLLTSIGTAQGTGEDSASLVKEVRR